MKKPNFKRLASLLTIVMIASLISLASAESSNIETQYITVWFDEACTQECNFIDWGTVYPDITKFQTIYLKNMIGKELVNLTIYAFRFNPAKLRYYTTLDWDAWSKTIPISQVLKVEISLHVEWGAPEGDFTFDILIDCDPNIEPLNFRYGGVLEIWFYGGD